ncbi:MAG: DUF4279 domain-containing protein [Candidatus Nitrotoga sp.]
MKHPRPSSPSDAPPGTVTLGGGPIGWFSAALHVTANELCPEEVSRLFGVEPTACQTKDVPLRREDGSTKRVPKFGRWTHSLKSAQTDEWDIEAVIEELLGYLPQKLEVWRQVAALGAIRISVGLALSSGNEEFELDPELMQFLGERNIGIYFDVYGESAK